MTEIEFANFPELTRKNWGIARCLDTGREMVYGYADEVSMHSKAELEAQRKWRQREQSKIRLRRKNFVVCPHDPVKELSQKLELHELGALIKLLPYLQLNRDGLLVKDGENMTIEVIGQVIGKERRATSTILNKLAKIGVIIKEGSRRKPSYSISHDYHWMGTVSDGVNFTKLYQLESRTRISNISIQDAGLLYKLLPYFHYETYMLCANPNEPDEEKIEFLSHDQLSEQIGEDTRVVRTHMSSLVRHGFVMKQITFGVVNYVVNPDIMFRSQYESDYTQVIRSQFAAAEKKAQLLAWPTDGSEKYCT